MKSLILTTLFALLGFTGFAQDEKPQDLVNRAKKLEQSGQFTLAAGLYAEAGDLFVKEADEGIEINMTRSYITARFMAAKAAYDKATENYEKGKMYASKTQMDQKKAALQTRIETEGYQIGSPTADQKKRIETPQPDAISTELDSAILLVTRFAQFRFNPPKAYRYTGQESQSGITNFTAVTLRKSTQQVEIGLQESGQSKNGLTLSDSFGRKTCELIGDPSKNEMAKYDEETKKRIRELQQSGVMSKDFDKLAGINDVLTKEVVDIGGAEACFMVEDRSTHPDGPQLSVSILFSWKGNMYTFGMIAPLHWKDALVASARTFRIAGTPPPPPDKCSAQEVYLMEGYAFYDTYRIPDPDKQITFSYAPTIERGKVQNGWHSIAEALKKTLSTYGDVQFVLKKRQAYYNQTESKEFMVFHSVGKFMDIPGFSKPNPVMLYLEAFDRMVTGVQGLESQISHMTADFYYVIPYIDVKVRCVPQMKCVNGKWEPDYQNMDYQILDSIRDEESNNLTFLTMKDIRDRQEKLSDQYDEMVRNQQRYRESSSCRLHKAALIDLPFPASPNECDKLEAKININKSDVEQHQLQIAAKERELAVFKSTRSVKAVDVDTEIDKYKREIKEESDAKKRAEDQLRNWQNNTSNDDVKDGNMKRLENEIADHEININRAEAILVLLRKEYSKYVDGQLELDWQKDIDNQKIALKKLQDEIKRQTTELKTCRAEEKRRR